MADTKLRVRKATDLLRDDHERVKELIARYHDMDADSGDQKAEIFEQIYQELTIHATIEEEIFYPSIEKVERTGVEDEGIVKEAREEHRIVKVLLSELAEMTVGDESFDEKLEVLAEKVELHADEEQEEMFPLYDQLDKAEQTRISEALMDRKKEMNPE